MRETTDDVLRRPVHVSDIIDALKFSDEQIEKAARQQPALVLTAARYRVKKMRRQHRKEAALKLLRAEKAKKFRRLLLENGQQRVTDKEIEEKLLRDSDIQEAMKELDESEEHEELSKLLMEAVRARGSSMKIIADLIGAEIYVARRSDGEDTGLDQISRKLKAKYPGRALKEERRSKR